MKITLKVIDIKVGRLTNMEVEIPDVLENKVNELTYLGYEFQGDDLGNGVYCFTIAYLNQHFLEKFASKGNAVPSVTKLVQDVNIWLAEEFKKDFDAEMAAIAEGPFDNA